MKKMFSVIALTFVIHANAQITNVACKNANKKIEVSFYTAPTSNLLVLIADSSGHTVFMDNRINYNGNYTGVLNTKNNKEKYHLKVISEAVRFDRIILPE
ncbi:MAG: hypothetical protein ACXVPN_01205 [Bacteroidia bacterium]